MNQWRIPDFSEGVRQPIIWQNEMKESGPTGGQHPQHHLGFANETRLSSIQFCEKNTVLKWIYHK